jgi:hypothetical protein
MVFAYGGAMIVRSDLRTLDNRVTHIRSVPGTTRRDASAMGLLEGHGLRSDTHIHRLLALRYALPRSHTL